jgi:hypothetical protein
METQTAIAGQPVPAKVAGAVNGWSGHPFDASFSPQKFNGHLPD